MSTDLEKFREKYPMYDHLSDQQVADNLYKSYSNMPRDEFNKKLGYTPEPEKSKFEQIHDQVEILNRAEDLKNSGVTLFGIVRDVAQGAIAAAPKLGQSLVGGAGELAEKAGVQLPQSMKDIQNFDWDKATSGIGSGSQAMEAELARAIGGYLPYAGAAGEKLAAQALAGGAHGFANSNPDQESFFGYGPTGRFGSTLEGALVNAAPAGILHGLEKARPSKFMNGGLSAEELQANLDATKGMPSNIADITGAPLVKRLYENMIAKMPFSGVNNKFEQIENTLTNRGENVLDKLRGNANHEDVGVKLHETLMNQFDKHQSNKSTMYDKVDKIAQKDNNFNIKAPTFAKKAVDYADAIESTNMLKYEPEVNKIFNKVKGYQNPEKEKNIIGSIVDTSGNPLINATEKTPLNLKEANILKGKLAQYSKMAASSPDATQRYAANVYSDLSKSLRTDINNSIKDSGNEELQQAYKAAESNYKKNFSPFLDKAIYKYISGNADPDTLAQTFIKTSKSSDRASLSNKLGNVLGENQPLLGYSYFSRALDNEGNLNLQKLSTLVSDLKPRQFKSIVPDETMRKQLKNISRGVKLNNKPLTRMVNQPTGQMALDYAPLAISHALSGLIGAGTGHNYGDHPYIGGIAGLIVPGLASRALTRPLTSEKLRESLVKEMIANKTKFATNKKIIGSQTLSQGLLESMKDKNK